MNVFPFLLLTIAAALLGSSSTLALDWPQWRGPLRNDVSAERGLLKTWPTSGPRKLWQFENAGMGYAGYSVVNGRLYTCGARDTTEMVIAIDIQTGREVWATPLGERYPNDWGDGPRSTPTVDGDYVFALSAKGTLACFQSADGKQVWQASMVELGGKIPGWGYCESPLVDGDQVVCTPGGDKGAIAALDKRTGKVRWQTTGFTDGAHYPSIVPATIRGAPQYVQLTANSIVGVGPTDGKVLWKTGFSGRVAVIPTPIVAGDQVYVSAGYGTGCKSVRLGEDGQPVLLYENKVMKNHHGGVILYGDHLYGYSDEIGWVCQDFKTGEQVWSSKNLGKGAVTCADGMLYLISEGDGTVVMIDASPKGWSEKGRFKLTPQTTQRKPQGRIWTHPVVSGGKLFLRDQELVSCFDVQTQH